MDENQKPMENEVSTGNENAVKETKTRTRIRIVNPFVRETIAVPVKTKKEKKAKKADAEKPAKTKTGFGKGFMAGFAAGSAFTAGAGFMGQKACRKKIEEDEDELEYTDDDDLDYPCDDVDPEVPEDSTEEPKEE